MATASSMTDRGSGPADPIVERRFLLRGVGWDGYEALLEWFGDDAPRMNYARGDVELMSPTSYEHERLKARLGYMVVAITDELNIRRNSAGSTTFKNRLADRGLEADECYYLANAGRIKGHKTIDLDILPPPDLCVEIEVSHSLLDKLDIYAGLHVPELWRYDGTDLTVMILGADSRYAESGRSVSFPYLPMDEVSRFLREHDAEEETAWGLGFRAWVRDVVAPLRERDRGQAGAG